MEIRLLGPVTVWLGDRRWQSGPPQQRAVLAVMAAEATQPVTVRALVDRVWGDQPPPAQARSAVRVHVNHIRRMLEQVAAADRGEPPATLVRHADGYLLDLGAATVDLHRFRRLVAAARGRDCQDADRVRLLTEALALWQGPALADVASDWAARMRERWSQERIDATVDWATAALRLGRLGEVIGGVRAALVEHPLVEPLAEVLMRALAATGRNAEALDCYASIRRALEEELGVDPAARLQQLHRAILRGELDQSPGPASVRPAVRPAAPAQLPADVHCFAGRRDELSWLDALLAKTADQQTAVIISVIGGTAGVGKTALAVHWAHRIAGQFPDGQLYVNLRGFDPTGPALKPATAIRGFLGALGVAPQRIPAELDAQAALYRTELAQRRMLIVLDNARDSAQVQPLLPGTGGCLVLVTSRNQLSGLVAAGGAQTLTLDLLSAAEARELLVGRLGPDRVLGNADAVAEIVIRCARLPLALAVVAARAATNPQLPLHALADDLRNAGDRLDMLSTDDQRTSVRAVFCCSYEALSPDAAQLFRYLGLHPGPDFSEATAASLAALARPSVRLLLTELAQVNLVVEHTPGRYTCHDLLHAYATDLTSTVDSKERRHATSHRLLDYYLHTAYSADRLLDPGRDPITLTPPQPGVAREHLADHEQAIAWFTAEHPGLLAAIAHADATGFDTQTWQLAWTLVDFLNRQGHWHDWVATQRVAAAAAERLDDALAQGRVQRNLALACIRLGRVDDGRTHLLQALDLTTRSGDLTGQAHAHLNLAHLSGLQGRHTEALDHAQQSLHLYQAAGHLIGQADALNEIGWWHAKLGHHQDALTASQAALTRYQELGDRHGESAAWDSAGYAQHHLGHHVEAIASYQHALDLNRALGHRYFQALNLAHLGDTHGTTGNHHCARITYQEALSILEQLHHEDAHQVRAKISELDPP